MINRRFNRLRRVPDQAFYTFHHLPFPGQKFVLLLDRVKPYQRPRSGGRNSKRSAAVAAPLQRVVGPHGDYNAAVPSSRLEF